MTGLSVRDVIGAVLMAAIGVFFLVGGLDLRFGSATSMGPGYLPTLLSVILILLSLVNLLQALKSGAELPVIAWRPVLAVSASVIAFGLVFPWFGLVPAIAATVLVAALGDRTSRLPSTIVVGLVLALMSWAIFRLGLGLPMPAFRGL